MTDPGTVGGVSGARPIGVQLYTLRELTRVDFEETLERVAAIGYLGVEFAQLHDMPPARLKAITADLGLMVIGAHAQADDGTARLDEAVALGANVLISNGGGENFASLDSIERFADRLNAALPDAMDRGLTLGYHNHWTEFSSRIDGRVAYDVFMDRLDPRVVAEVDAFWVTVGGGNPVEVIAALGDRVRFVHVKDGVEVVTDGNHTAVGSGSLDIPAITRANPFVEWHVVELDRCATDMFEAVERSYRYLVDRGLSRGSVA